MNIKKSLLVAGAVTSVGLTGLAGVGVASAATQPAAPSDPMNNLIDKIATKFNLNKDEVKTVFDEQRIAHQAERAERFATELDQLVTDGKITAEQKEKLVAKRDEIKKDMEANRDAMKDKTAAERKTLMEQKRAELEQWAKDNGIDAAYLRLVMGGSHGGPRGERMMGRGMDGSSSVQSSTSEGSTD